MVRGGARANSGPEPDPFSFRTAQRLKAGEALPLGWVVLPVTGRAGEPPEWPLTVPTERERAHWARLWKTPQATQWERLGVDLEVALYVRRLVEVEQPGASAAIGSLLVRMAEALGLTIPGLQARKWQLGGQDGPAATVTPIHGGERVSSRERFQTSARDRLPRGLPTTDEEND